MLNKLGTFIRLPWQEKHFFCHAVFLLYSYRVRLKFFSLETILNLVEKEEIKFRSKRMSFLSVGRIKRLVQAASVFVPFATCLSNALAGQVLFATCNYSTKLHVGVRNEKDKGFEAHAWLTLEEDVVLGNLPDLLSYKELPPLSIKNQI